VRSAPEPGQLFLTPACAFAGRDWEPEELIPHLREICMAAGYTENWIGLVWFADVLAAHPDIQAAEWDMSQDGDYFATIWDALKQHAEFLDALPRYTAEESAS
jgi:hypothetical protein